MSENLTRTAVVEDCLHIMRASSKTCDAFKEVSREHANFAQFGSLTRPGDTFPLQLLAEYRNNWEARKTVKGEIGFRSAPLVPKTEAESVLAFVLGWICHRAVSQPLEGASGESGLYQDAFLFRRLYMEPESASAAVTARYVAEWFQALQQRFLIEMHTFVPDADHIEGWFDKLHVKYAERAEYMEQYAEAIINPDPAKVKQYVTDSSFYHEEDAIIQLAESLRKGAVPSEADIEAALESECSSNYAKALRQGVGSLLIANAFFKGSIDQEELNAILAV
jgi:hypothetical protein